MGNVALNLAKRRGFATMLLYVHLYDNSSES